jgi:cytochrome c biogenesis protein CcmG, thiol:disulfide interchange protein DsbE
LGLAIAHARWPISKRAGSSDAANRVRPLSWRLIPLGVFLVLAAVFVVALRQGEPQRLPSALLNKPAPALALAPLPGLQEQGRDVPGLDAATLASGGPTVVNFWASWCAPCIEEHPVLIELVRQTQVRLIGINYKDQVPNARRFLARYGNPFSHVAVDADGKAALEWGVTGMPETFILDGVGRIVYKHVGAITPQALQREIIPALQKAMRAARG